MDIVIWYCFVYVIIGLLVGLINVKRIDKTERKEWVAASIAFWPVYIPCLLFEKLEDAIEFVSKQIKKYKK